MNSQIEDLFLEIETLIKLQLKDKIQNNSEKFTKKFEKYSNTHTEETIQFRLFTDVVNQECNHSKSFSNFNNDNDDKPSKIENISTKLIKHLKFLNLLAHRTKNPNCLFWLQGIHKSQGDELFKLISEFKELLLNKLKNSLEFEDKINDYEKYCMAMIFGKLRWIIITHQKDIGTKIFDKVNGIKKEEGKKEEENLSLDSSTEIKSEIKSEIKFEIKSEIKFRKRVIQNSISNDLTNMTTKLFVEADRSLVRYQASNKEVLSAKKHATLNIFKGQLSMVSGVVSGGSSVIVGLTNIYKATSTLGIPALLIVGGAAAIGFGVWCGLSLYKKGTKMLKEPKIREKLNEIMIKVLGAYDKGEYQEFIDALSEEYDEKNHKILIKCCNGIANFRKHAKRIFREALNNDLVEEVKKLNDCTSELRKAKEIRNIARINIAILNITEYDLCACKEAIKTVEEVRKSIKENYQFVSKAEFRLKILEDFFWTICFECLAEKEVKINKLNSLRFWQRAQKNYESVRKIDPKELTYSLGYSSCLLKLSKYTQVIDLPNTCPELNSSSEYWHFCNPKNYQADKHRELISKLETKNIVKHHIDRYKNELIYEIDYLKNSHNNEPGTSTGGIIAAGLSIPQFECECILLEEHAASQFEYNYSNLKSRFSASELLNIYKDESEKFFTGK
ncbi:18313_t:CDS:10 [Gigaspora margarita]|uniref:18313_t:CDS:1 n=1 Tax=Gigaspora margarita TaxID=4874 RepID=A0ABN7UUT1_GIGMA|nr:18313_t:CDS:10 [Gigaspora margarita]